MKQPNFAAMSPAVAKAIEQMMVEQGDKFSLEKVNLAELERRTGISRARLRRMKEHDFEDAEHASKGRKASTTLLSGYTGILDGLLKAGVTNSAVCLSRLRANGYHGGKTIVKDYIAAHQHLVPPARYAVAPQGNRGRRYTTGPGEAFQMDWGFTKVQSFTGEEYSVACFAIVICLIGMIIGSCFGIFFSGEDSGTGQTMQTAVQEINTDYQDRLDEIKASHSYDVLEMSGSRAVWKEVLAVYAVKTTTDPDAAQEVATMDDTKKQLLKDIFWQMNEISSSTDTKTETVIETSDDGNGNIVETETTVTQTYLYITVSHKTAEEMANQFGFNEDQREQMAELLADENNSLWSQVLYGISGGDGEIVTVALSQVGNVGGEPYWSWYGFDSRVEWCACFVSWCANECGYIEAGVIPKFAACASQGVPWFQERGLWQDNSYEPRPGDIIFFDWDDGGQDGSSDHVGIVEKVENGRVYTIEGNSGDSCRQNSYPIGYYEIYGYGTPAY